MTNLTEFLAKVPVNGFQWLESEATIAHPLGWFLALKGPGYKPTRVLKENGLFRKFGETPADKTGILEFANEHGFLAYGRGDSREVRPFGPSESFEFWFQEIHDMRAAVNLWESARSADLSALSKFIAWDRERGFGKSLVYYQRQPFSGIGGFTVADEAASPDSYSKFVTGDLIQPAFHALQQIVNTKLRQCETIPRLLWDHGRNSSELKVRLAPSTLLATLWLQLAYGIDGNRQYRQCEACSVWIEISSSTGQRDDVRFCRDSCKTRAYRQRKKQAIGLRAAGKGYGEIARALHTELKVIKGWLAK